MAVKCLLMANLEGKPLTNFDTREFPTVPRIGEIIRLVDGDLKMHFVVRGVQYTPDDPIDGAEAILLIDEIPGSRDGAYRDFLTTP